MIEGDDPPLVAAPPRGIGRAALYGVGILCASLVIAALVHRGLALLPFFFRAEDDGRQHEMMQALPTVLDEQGPLGLLLGPSTMQRLNPVVLDDTLRTHGIELRSYNLALNGMPAAVLGSFAEHLRTALAKRKKRVSLAVVDVSLPLLTALGSARAHDARIAFLEVEDADTIARWLPHEPGDALETFYRKVILGDQHVADLADFVTARVLNREWPCRSGLPVPITSDDYAKMRAYCTSINAVGPGPLRPSWNPATRGFPRRVYPETEAAYTAAFTPNVDDPARVRQHLARLQRKSDALELHFDETAIADFVSAVHVIQSFSDHVVLLVAPENPHLVRTADADARLAALLQRIAVLGPIIDLHRDPRFVATDFLDGIHIESHPRSSDKFARVVADELAAILTRAQ